MSAASDLPSSDLIESVRQMLSSAEERYQRSVGQNSELACPACHDLRGAWKEALDALRERADVLIAALQSSDPARVRGAQEPFAEAVREETVTLTSFVRHLDDHLKNKRLTT